MDVLIIIVVLLLLVIMYCIFKTKVDKFCANGNDLMVDFAGNLKCKLTNTDP